VIRAALGFLALIIVLCLLQAYYFGRSAHP
jgi:hypothetical protein